MASSRLVSRSTSNRRRRYRDSICHIICEKDLFFLYAGTGLGAASPKLFLPRSTWKASCTSASAKDKRVSRVSIVRRPWGSNDVSHHFALHFCVLRNALSLKSTALPTGRYLTMTATAGYFGLTRRRARTSPPRLEASFCSLLEF